MNIKELKKLIQEVKIQRSFVLREYTGGPARTEQEAEMQFDPKNIEGATESAPGDQDPKDMPDGGLSDEEKARSFEDLFRDMKVLLESWKERMPETVAGKYFHDLLHLVKAYDPSYFPNDQAIDIGSTGEEKKNMLDRP